MNVIWIEPDCSKYWPNTEAVSALVGDASCRVQHLIPGEMPAPDPGCRCVLLSSFRSGITSHHRALVVENPQVRLWLFSAVGSFLPGERQQLTENLEQILAGTNARYAMVFDQPENLAATKAQCGLPIPQGRCCLIVSKNPEAALRCRQMLAPLLPAWDVLAETDQPEAAYAFADVILAAGTAAEDFALPPPPFSLGRTFAWLEQTQTPEADPTAVYSVLTAHDWALASPDHVFCSDPQLEQHALRLLQGETTPLALAHEDSFILCDSYRLPLRSSDYTEERICSYLNQMCCLAALAERFQ